MSTKASTLLFVDLSFILTYKTVAQVIEEKSSPRSKILLLLPVISWKVYKIVAIYDVEMN